MSWYDIMINQINEPLYGFIYYTCSIYRSTLYEASILARIRKCNISFLFSVTIGLMNILFIGIWFSFSVFQAIYGYNDSQ